MSVVGLASAPPAPLSKKAAAAAKKLASAPLNSQRGVDPAITTVAKAAPVASEGDSGRPDKATYDLELNGIKRDIDVLTAKANDVKGRIASAGKGGNNERKTALRAELDALRGEQARVRGGRGKTMDQVKAMQDALSTKIKELVAAKSKATYKSVAEVDGQIKSLERQVEGGMMKLVDEKKALNEISTLKKTRKAVESFSTQQALIDADKAKIDEIRAGLDDPEARALSDKFTAAKAELDAIHKVNDESSKGRDTLYEERNLVSKQLDELYTKKNQCIAAFRTANDKWYTKRNDDRTMRMERQKAEQAEHDQSRRSEINERLLEEAQAPAFEREIEDCRTIIKFFQQRLGVPVDAYTPLALSSNGSLGLNLPKLDLRVIEQGPPAGGVALKKKGEGEEEFFMGGGKKGKKGPWKVEESAAPKKDEALNLPMGMLSALITLGIESPIKLSDVQGTIDALQVKCKYFTENQARVTKEKIATAEKRIATAEAKSAMDSTPTPVEPEAAVVDEKTVEEKEAVVQA